MKITIQNASSVPDEKQLDAVEVSLGTKLQPEYRSFVARHDGGAAAPNVFPVSERVSSGVSAFIPVAKIDYERALLDKRVAAEFFPIAYAEGGNLLCLAIDPSKPGVFFVDHEVPGLEAVTKVGSSLKDFLDQLTPFDSAAIQLKPGQVKKAWIDPSFLK